mmetsp:Transcript_1323/g.3687  ORF Transcript_1323/g.3687 Transcript_1323/m.3687 type:complete len:103 (+) Transcript_1323:685-993(+)
MRVLFASQVSQMQIWPAANLQVSTATSEGTGEDALFSDTTVISCSDKSSRTLGCMPKNVTGFFRGSVWYVYFRQDNSSVERSWDQTIMSRRRCAIKVSEIDL